MRKNVTFCAPRGSTSRGQGRNTVKTPLIFASTIVAAIMVGAVGASLFLCGDRQIDQRPTRSFREPSSDLSQPNESGSLSDPKGESPGAQSMNPGEAVSVSKEQVDQRPTSASPSLKPNVNKVQVTPTSSTVRPMRVNPPPSSPAEPASVRPDDEGTWKRMTEGCGERNVEKRGV